MKFKVKDLFWLVTIAAFLCFIFVYALDRYRLSKRRIELEKAAEETESTEKKVRRTDAFKIMQDEIEMFLADLGLPNTFADRKLRPPDFADLAPTRTNAPD